MKNIRTLILALAALSISSAAFAQTAEQTGPEPTAEEATAQCNVNLGQAYVGMGGASMKAGQAQLEIIRLRKQVADLQAQIDKSKAPTK